MSVFGGTYTEQREVWVPERQSLTATTSKLEGEGIK